MNTLDTHLARTVNAFLATSYSLSIQHLEFQATRPEFEGDRTMVLFSLLRDTKSNPQTLGDQIGTYLVGHSSWVTSYNVVKGFLNLSISDLYYLDFLNQIREEKNFGHQHITKDSETVMVEFSSPNTNKPLHLGHIRNNLLGYSISKIIEATGKKVIKTQIINDRGIHICKSMVAWRRFGNGETPEDSSLKGDQLVGKYYVLFDQKYKAQIQELIDKGMTEKESAQKAPILLEAQELLRLWESNDSEVRQLWKTMNNWVYKGFEKTYADLGVSFDSYYYESNTYLLGKSIIKEGLSKGVFYKKEDGSLWVNLTAEGLDEKLLLRSDGTAVYMTQDLGTAQQRVEDHPEIQGMVYTVGNEQDYHFKVLFLILKKLGYSWADSLFHLSYGMVDLPSGKMKSREGTVVDADDLMLQMEKRAKNISEEYGKLDALSEEEKNKLYHDIGLGALKYFILKVDPKKRILFDPDASVDFNGNTGPFIQYTYARIQSILRKSSIKGKKNLAMDLSLDNREKEIVKQLVEYPEVVQQAAQQHSPALIANYVYELVKRFNSFYQNISILGEMHEEQQYMRILLSRKVADTIRASCTLLGINVPNRM